MIPKIIHFSWISDDPYPPLIQKCIASWKKYAPDYEIIRWDKDRFDLSSLAFTQQAYERKKWAFISDFQRLYALYHHGGIYLDSDVELVKPLDPLLENPAFLGFQNPDLLEMWVLGFEKGHPWVKRMLDYYNDRPFITADGSMDEKPNTFIVTEISLEEYGLTLGDEEQYIAGDVRVYPQRFFAPAILLPGKMSVTKDTYAIHHFTGAWKSPEWQAIEKTKKRKQALRNVIRLFIGSKMASKLGGLTRKKADKDA